MSTRPLSDQLRAIESLRVGQRLPPWYNQDTAIKALAEQLHVALLRIEALERHVTKGSS